MVKQVKTKKVAATRVVKPVAADAVRNVWLAGLGAFAIARRQGLAAFDAFVSEGQRVQAKGEKVARTLGKDVELVVKSRLQPVRQRFAEVRRTVEARIDTGTGRALAWLGVPSKTDVDALVKRIDTLSKQLREPRRATAR
ncbi:MAG TPA: phasin family protein [Dokdonella sp.]|uniref:phasin family protein n=1 Tax=Dokdonella sp. TaxID=2291710 RepID=UPI0025C00337|nr:phasin family protein [Dokdonella sp.]MBX3693456.1 phasin family protein [Dokdonella sp.]HNR91923.1 phasin family protein [Dokdonella sp.]